MSGPDTGTPPALRTIQFSKTDRGMRGFQATEPPFRFPAFPPGRTRRPFALRRRCSAPSRRAVRSVRPSRRRAFGTAPQDERNCQLPAQYRGDPPLLTRWTQATETRPAGTCTGSGARSTRSPGPELTSGCRHRRPAGLRVQPPDGDLPAATSIEYIKGISKSDY